MSFKKVSFLSFYLIFIIQTLAANFAHPVTPTIISNLGLHDYMFGVAFACMAFGNFIFAPFWGKYSDKVGRVKVLVICGIGYGFGQALFGLATTELGIAAARIIAGCFTGGSYVVELSYLVDITDDTNRGKHFNIFVTFNSVFSAFGYLIGGFLGDISVNLMFIVQSITLMSTGILFGIFLKDVEYQHFVKKASIPDTLKDSNPFKSFSVGKAMTAVMLILTIMNLLTAFGTTAYEQCFNYYLKDQLNFSPSYNGLLKAFLGFVALAANFTVGLWIMKKTKLKHSMITTTILCGASMFLILFANDVKSFIVINTLAFALNTIYQPILQTLFADYAEGSDNGMVMGVFGSVRSFGNIIGALFAGFIYAMGAKLTFIFAGAAFIATAFLGNVANRKDKDSYIQAGETSE